jgi:hypothetical protein
VTPQNIEIFKKMPNNSWEEGETQNNTCLGLLKVRLSYKPLPFLCKEPQRAKKQSRIVFIYLVHLWRTHEFMRSQCARDGAEERIGLCLRVTEVLMMMIKDRSSALLQL